MGAGASAAEQVDFEVQKSLHQMSDYSQMDTYLDERIADGSPPEKQIANQIKLLKTEVYACFDCNDVGYTYKDREGMFANLDFRGDSDIFECVTCSNGNNLGPVGFNPTDKCARIVKSGVRQRGFMERIVTLDFNEVETALDNDLIPNISPAIAKAIRADLQRKDSLMSFLIPLINPRSGLSKKEKEFILCGVIAQIIMKPAMVKDAVKYINMEGAEELFQAVENTEGEIKQNNYDQTIFSESVKRMIHELIVHKMPPTPRKELDEATGAFQAGLSSLGFNTTHFHVAADWEAFKFQSNSGRYRVMAEMSRLKTLSEEKVETCYRFTLWSHCKKLHENESFAFVFVMNKGDQDKAIKILIRTITYMFSDAKTETIAQCYNWATQDNDLNALAKTCTCAQVCKGDPKNTSDHHDIIQPLRLKFVEIEASTVLQVRNELFSEHFQEGILHRDGYDKNVKRWGTTNVKKEVLDYEN